MLELISLLIQPVIIENFSYTRKELSCIIDDNNYYQQKINKKNNFIKFKYVINGEEVKNRGRYFVGEHFLTKEDNENLIIINKVCFII